MDGPYANHIIDANDVCNGCLRVVRQERVDPTRGGLTREYEDSLERDPRTTEVGYAPADSVSEQKGVFCAHCGTESPHERIWDDADIDRERFKTLVVRVIKALRAKGLSLHATRLAGVALQARTDGDDVDDALRRGVSAGLRASAMSEKQGEDARAA